MGKLPVLKQDAFNDCLKKIILKITNQYFSAALLISVAGAWVFGWSRISNTYRYSTMY